MTAPDETDNEVSVSAGELLDLPDQPIAEQLETLERVHADLKVRLAKADAEPG